MTFGAYYMWRQREREAVATRFSRRPYATLEWRWILHTSNIYGITAFTLYGLPRNMPLFSEDNFLILEHKVTFGFVPYPPSVLIYKNRPQGSRLLTPRLSCQWSVAQQRDSRPGYITSCCWIHLSIFLRVVSLVIVRLFRCHWRYPEVS